MTRLVPCLAAALPVLLLAQPALAGDLSSSGFSNGYQNFFGNTDDLRSGFSEEFDNSNAYDPLSFELGTRYWYSWGSQSFSIGNGNPPLSVNDQSQSVEAYARVDDNSTGYYAKAIGGASFVTNGSFAGLDNGTVDGGHIGYAGADIGYSFFGGAKGAPSFGPFVGYMYWNDSPNASSDNANNNFTTANSAADIGYDQDTGQTFVPGDSRANAVDMNMLRLGVSGKAQFGNFDISGELAAVPYAKMDGTLGSTAGAATYYNLPPGSSPNPDSPGGQFNLASIQASPTEVNGWGYGAMGEAMIGFHPTDNLTFRLGGRLWYLQGKQDATYSRAVIGNPTDSNPPDPGDPNASPPVPPSPNPPNFDTPPSFSKQGYITRDNPWSIFRYGLLAEMTYNF